MQRLDFLKAKLLGVAAIAGIVGFLFYGVVRFVPAWWGRVDISTHDLVRSEVSYPRQTSLFFWQHERLRLEVVSLLWRGDATENLRQLVNVWLELLYEEQIIPVKASVSAATIDPARQHALISLDQQLFGRDWSVIEKWRCVQGMCRTIHAAQPPLTKLTLLVNHQPMQDDHLDLAAGVSINGFLENKH